MVDTFSVIKLCIAALIPVALTIPLYLLEKNTPFGKINNIVRQIIYGIIFGAVAIVGTEWGIPMNGAQVNCRDAAVLIAGLIFGGPAGIIAGIIGGVERWIAVAWGVGTFTRVACTVSTILAGVYAAVLRKHLFEDKKPGVFISFTIGVVMEVFHLLMVFVTNIGEVERAISVVKSCTVPMVLANGFSVLLAAVFVSLLAKERKNSRKTSVRISQTIQKWLLVTVVLAFAVTSFFIYKLQDAMADSQTENFLSIAIDEIADDISDASDANLIEIAENVRNELMTEKLENIVKKRKIAEINVVNSDGIIVSSNVKKYIGFDFSSGEQSAEFLCLLGNTNAFVQEYGPISYDNTTMRKYVGIKTATGFLQIGYDAEQFQRDIDSQVVGITKNRHIGRTGFVIIVDENNNLVSVPDGIDLKKLVIEEKNGQIPEENTTFMSEFDGKSCFMMYKTVEGYHILSVYPEDEAMRERDIVLFVNTFLEILVFAALFMIIYLLIKKVVVNKIKIINESLGEITDGNLGVVVNVRSNEEFASLSDDINMTVDTLKKYIDEASARIDKELEFAKNIQASALPSDFPAFPKRKDFDVFASMNPAKEVGGDFYDFYLTHENTFNFLVADVSGKGIPAAMFMMRAKTELKSLTEGDAPISEVFTHGNAALCEGNDAGMFVTAWQGSANLESGVVKFANAGHNPPLVYHKSTGKFEYLRSKVGFVLAGMDGVKYKEQEIVLQKGDVVFLYTDGVTEATNANTELYGEERLLDTINSREFDNVREMCEYIKADVDAFVGNAPQFDDITMLAFKFVGQPEYPSIKLENAVIDDITKVTDFIEAELEKLDCPMKAVMQINVAVDELLSNIIKYGYQNQTGPVEVRVVTKPDEPEAVYIRFCDSGIPYNPLTKEDPDVTLSAEERGIGGLGIFIVRKTMDDIKYKYENDQNILTIKKTWGEK